MRIRRISHVLTLPVALLFGGCGYVHLGKLPEPPAATVIGDDKLLKENSDLKLEKKMLQQELALTRAQGDALRMAIENRAADGDTSKRLVERLNETSRELATLRAGYAKLQSERDQAVAGAAEASALRTRLGATEEKLAASLRTYTELQDEIGRLRTEVDRTRTENVALSEQARTATAQNAEAQAALAQLNSQLLAQKDARAAAEQDAETLRTQLKAVAPDASALAQQRTGAATEARSLAAEHAAEVAALKEQLDATRGKLDTLEAEREQLKKQLATVETAAPPPALADIEAKLATALQTASALRQENEQLKAPASQAQALRDQLREVQTQAATLIEENARLKGRLTANRPGAESTRIELTNEKARASAPGEPTRIELTDSDAPAPSGGGTITRTNASGVSATLVANVSGGARREPAAPGQPRFHVVAGGDTLSKISALYYGTPARWTDILAANRDILGESNNLVIGRTLRIP